MNSGPAKAGDDEDLKSNPQWLKFLESLRSRGFFQNELEGSQHYQRLLSSAKEYFISHVQDDQNEELTL